MNLFMQDLSNLTPTNKELSKISKIIDWTALIKLLKSKKNGNKIGRKGYGVKKLYCCVFLQSWYNLTDRQIESELPQRIDYLLFMGLNVGEKTPSRSTIENFRKYLVNNNLYEKIFKFVLSQIKKLGIIDATVIESYFHPRFKSIESILLDRKENEISVYNKRISYSNDKDAMWLYKNRKYHYGYKLFLMVNETGQILNYKLTPANAGECPHLPDLVSDIKVEEIQADKAYYSKANAQFLEDNHLINGLMKKASRNHPLSQADKEFNKRISKTRFIVERTNGQLKRRFNFAKTSYNGLKKVLCEAIMKATCSNILLSLKHIIL